VRSLGRIIRNAIHFLVSNLLGFAMGLVASVVMARTLGPNDLGIFHQAQWFAGTISVCLSLGFMTAVTKFTAQFKGEGRLADMSAAIRYIYVFEFVIGLVSSIGLICFATPIADHYFSKQESYLFVLAFLAITPGLLSGVLSSALEGAQIFRYQTIHALTLSPLSLIAKVTLLYLGYGLKGLFWANLVFAGLNLIFHHWTVHREGLLKKDWGEATKEAASGTTPDSEDDRPPWRKQLFTYMRSMTGIHFVDLLVWSRSENYFLGRYCQAAEIAYYNLAQNLLLRFTGILPNLMWKLLLPITSEHHGREDHGKLRKTYHLALRYAACISFPTITACYLASYELIVIFYGHAYSEAKNCFQILCLGVILTSLAQPSSAALYATNRHNFILRYGLLLGVLNIIVNILWIPSYGASGAAASYALTTGLGAIGGFVYTWQSLRFSMPFGSFMRCAIACLAMGLTLFSLLRFPVEPFNIFAGLRSFLQAHTGHDAEILLGARTVRVLFALTTGMAAYVSTLLWVAKPHAEDLRVVESLQRYLPGWFMGPLRNLVAARLNKAAPAPQ
jgi:O-antigen/teichoic acid export membrane protein